MASGTKILVSFCAMIVGVLVLYYGVIMPANEPVRASEGSSMAQKIADADQQNDVQTSEAAQATADRPLLIDPDPGKPALSGLGQPTELADGRSQVPDSLDVDHRQTGEGMVVDSLAGAPLEVMPPPLGQAESSVRPIDPNGRLVLEGAGVSPNPGSIAPPPMTAPGTLDEGRPTVPATSRPALPPANQPDASTAATQPTAKPESSHVEYVVKAGDTGVSIAKSWFGDGNKWVLISRANPWVDFNKLQVGQKLKLPPKNATAATAKQEATANDRRHTVRSGDTLIGIAREVYGDATMWESLYEANRKTIGNDPADLAVGMVLTLPPPPGPKRPATE